jgi:fibronectin-binding autotransporter adhesin
MGKHAETRRSSPNDSTRAVSVTSSAANAVSFSTAVAPPASDAAIVEAGFDVRISAQARFGISNFGELASRVQDHAVKGKFSLSF